MVLSLAVARLVIHQILMPFNLVCRADGVTFPIIGILIHDEVNIAMVCVNECSTLNNVQTIDLVLVNASNCAFSGRLGEDSHIRICEATISTPIHK